MLNHLLKRAALGAIALYRRHLSPLKRFSCAYRIGTGRASCSAHGYRVIERYGVWLGYALLQRRWHACAGQHRRLLRARPMPRPLHPQAGSCDVSCDGCDVGSVDCSDIIDCGSSMPGSVDCPNVINCGSAIPGSCSWSPCRRAADEPLQYPPLKSAPAKRKKVSLVKPPAKPAHDDSPKQPDSPQ
ncbi:putative component of membrane protein insertase Oxa1/YidC/SpoIIIJ protein YidD [Oxalobacteraceae bacterium GrIS 1.11]